MPAAYDRHRGGAPRHPDDRAEGPASDPTKRQDQPTSVLLRRAIEDSGNPSMTVGELLQALGDRSFGLVFILLALGNVIPGPPGLGGLFAVPMLYFAVQLALGRRTPGLPGFVMRRTISRATLLRVIDRARPWLERLERACRPRWIWLVRGAAERAAAATVALMAVVITLPIPLTGVAPAIAVVVLSLGILERDGRTVLVGYFAALVALGIVMFAVSVYAVSLRMLFQRAFG